LWWCNESQGDDRDFLTRARLYFITRRVEMAAVTALKEVRKALTTLIVLARLLALIKSRVCARRRVQERACAPVTFAVGTHLLEHPIRYNSAQIGEVFWDSQLVLRDRLALELAIIAIRAEKTAITTLEVRDAVAFWFVCAQALAFFKRDFSWRLHKHLLIADIAFGVVVPQIIRCFRV